MAVHAPIHMCNPTAGRPRFSLATGPSLGKLTAGMTVPELKGRVVVITGGAQGIGAAMVRAFHAEGAQVCFGDLEEGSGQALVRELGGRIAFRKLDLTRERSVRQWIASLGKKWRSIDVLINNAAADPRMPLAQTSAREWDQLFARNLRAFFLTARESASWMHAGASIINFSSITFHTAPAGMSAYVATKGGILAFTRALARELGPRRIRVNTISPGWVMTERQLRQFVTPAVKRLVKRSQCIPDLIQPEEIAQVALFLAGEGSRAITGQEILVDRGWAFS
jgi:NAD(P)-dependent dehydrogenase (short-subunit alcohol dehydrogenase family)